MAPYARDPQALKRKLGGYVRQGLTEAADDVRRELAEANLAAYIERTANAMPPMTAEQRTRLAVLLLAPTSDTAA